MRSELRQDSRGSLLGCEFIETVVFGMNFESRRATIVTIVDSERSYDVVFSANHLKKPKRQ